MMAFQRVGYYQLSQYYGWLLLNTWKQCLYKFIVLAAWLDIFKYVLKLFFQYHPRKKYVSKATHFLIHLFTQYSKYLKHIIFPTEVLGWTVQ